MAGSDVTASWNFPVLLTLRCQINKMDMSVVKRSATKGRNLGALSLKRDLELIAMAKVRNLSWKSSRRQSKTLFEYANPVGGGENQEVSQLPFSSLPRVHIVPARSLQRAERCRLRWTIVEVAFGSRPLHGVGRRAYQRILNPHLMQSWCRDTTY